MRIKTPYTWKTNLGELSKLNKSSLAWLAGTIDCDGSIFFVHYKPVLPKYKETVYPRISFGNTNKLLVEKVAEILKTKTKITYSYDKLSKYSDGFKRKPFHTISLQRTDDVRIVLELIVPYLVAKKQKALEVLDFINNKDRK